MGAHKAAQAACLGPQIPWKQEACTYNGPEIIRYWFTYPEDIKSLTDKNVFLVYTQNILEVITDFKTTIFQLSLF